MMSGDWFFLLPMLSILFSLLLPAVGFYVLFLFYKQGRERNAYLKEVVEELRKKSL